MVKTPIPTELPQRLRESGRLLITSHANPDGDAIGSELGLARAMGALGKAATVWNHDPTPPVYSPLAGCERIHVGEAPPAGFPASFDVAVVLECPTLDRTGLEDLLQGLPLINVDHHLGNGVYGDVNWIDTSAAAVGQMIFHLLREMHVSIDEQTADALYLALVSDTGGFRFSNSTPAAFVAASEMVSAGASPERVSQWLYERRSVGALHLQSLVLQTLQLHRDGTIASVVVTPDMYREADAERGDSEGLIDYPRSIAGVEAVALLRELSPGEFKISLRSRGDVDVEVVARSFGGGGHRNAAGCKLTGDLDVVRSQIEDALAEALR